MQVRKGMARVRCGRAIAITLLGSAGWASAQPPVANSGTSAAPGARGLSEIVVTAQKRSENLQKVPISVSAVSGAAIANMHAATIQGLQGSIPNVQIDNFSNTPNTAVFTIRGIGVIDPDPYAGNTVSIVLDGVPQLFSTGALVDLYDVDRVEVLRGPQGTLFGANTTGGVVNIVDREPQSTFGLSGELTTGNYNRLEAKGVVNLPVSEALSTRFAVSHSERDGYVTNVVDGTKMGDRNVNLYRASVKFKPASNFDAVLVGEYDRSRNGAPVVVNGALPGEPLYIPAGVDGMYPSVCQTATARCGASGAYYSANDSVPDISNMDSYRGTLTLNWRDTPIGDLTAISGYKHLHLLEYTDQDATPEFLADTRRTITAWQFTQELRDSIDVTSWARLLIGGFYAKDHYDLSNNFRVQYAAPGLMQINTQDQGNYSASAFAQTYIDISDRLRAQAGVRYTHERTRMNAETVTSINPSGTTDFFATGNTVLQTVVASGAKSWNNVGWKLGLDYKLTGATMLYGYWARGFKSGGFVGRVGLPSDIGPFNPEHVDTFEGGIKADLLDHKLRANLSGFYTSYRDLQVAQIYVTTDPATGLPLQGNTIQNAGKAEIKGFELETSALPARGLTLTGSLAYLDARYKNFPYLDPVSLTTRNLRGLRLQNAPRWAATAGATYTTSIGESSVTAHAQYSYTASKYLTAVEDTPRALIQPMHLVDANLDFALPDKRYTISLWGKNLLDKRYLASMYDAPGYSGLGSYAAPREFGATFKVEWR